jgi:oxygen-independent coproporphyrinogen-3 oxidase
LVVLSDQSVDVTPLGWFFVRSVAAVFDRHLQADRARERYSKII